jgi:hypothetical protein
MRGPTPFQLNYVEETTNVHSSRRRESSPFTSLSRTGSAALFSSYTLNRFATWEASGFGARILQAASRTGRAPCPVKRRSAGSMSRPIPFGFALSRGRRRFGLKKLIASVGVVRCHNDHRPRLPRRSWTFGGTNRPPIGVRSVLGDRDDRAVAGVSHKLVADTLDPTTATRQIHRAGFQRVVPTDDVLERHPITKHADSIPA